MKDNTHHMPSSTRSCRTPLPRSTAPGRRVQSLLGKIRTKSVQIRPFSQSAIFSSDYLPTTYNFTALKCTDFRVTRRALPPPHTGLDVETHDLPIARGGRSLFPLPRGEGKGEGQISTALFPSQLVDKHCIYPKPKLNRNAAPLHKPCQRSFRLRAFVVIGSGAGAQFVSICG